jgi:hypothetical protein
VNAGRKDSLWSFSINSLRHLESSFGLRIRSEITARIRIQDQANGNIFCIENPVKILAQNILVSRTRTTINAKRLINIIHQKKSPLSRAFLEDGELSIKFHYIFG